MSKVQVIIPCYNEEKRLNMAAFSDFLTRHSENYSYIFVNDGSKDQTITILKEFEKKFPQHTSILDLGENVGKAEAIRLGMMQAQKNPDCEFVAYFDADLATPLDELVGMFDLFEKKKDLLLVLCSRIKRLGADVVRKRKRHLLGRVFSTFTSLILKLPVYDTQCGAKMLRKEIVPLVFTAPFLTNWLFDIEIITRIRNRYPENIEALLYEFPVNVWKDIAGSKLKAKHMLQVPFDLLKIHRTYNKTQV